MNWSRGLAPRAPVTISICLKTEWCDCCGCVPLVKPITCHNQPVLRSFHLPLPATLDGVLDISLVHHPNCQEMDSFGYGSANPLRNAAKTIRTLVNDQREYLVGIALLLIVVFLWALSNFVTQVRGNSFSPHAPLIFPLRGVGYFPRRIRETILVRSGHDPAKAAEAIDLFVTIILISRRFRRVTWLNTSAFALYLIPTALKWLLGKGSRDAPHNGAYTVDHDHPPCFSYPEIVSQNDLGVDTRGWPLTLHPRTTILMCDTYHLHIQELPLTHPRSIGRCRREPPCGGSPTFNYKRNAAVGFHLLFHLVRGQLDRKCVSGLYQRCECDYHVQHERYGLAVFDASGFLIGLFRFLYLGHWSDIQGGIVIVNKGRCRCDKVRGTVASTLVVRPLNQILSRI